MTKKLLLGLAFLAFMSVGVSQNYHGIFDLEYGYSGSDRPEKTLAYCEEGPDCKGEVIISLPDEGDHIRAYRIPSCGAFSDGNYLYKVGCGALDSQDIPPDVRVAPGISQLEVQDGRGGSGQVTWLVDYRTSGSMLRVDMNPTDVLEGGDPDLHEFRFDYTDGTAEPGEVRMDVEGACGSGRCLGYFEAQRNTILTPGIPEGEKSVDNLEDFVLTSWEGDIGNCNTASYCKIAKFDFQDMAAHCSGNCPVGHRINGEKPSYRPRGEIMVGKSFDPQEGWPDRLRESEERFHICDSDFEDRDIDPIDQTGKTVYSPGSNFEENAFYCNGGEWIPREKCEPGEEWRQESGSWNCFSKETEYMEVKFFDIEGMPFEELYSSFLAGFKIPGEEVRKFEEYYQRSRLKRIQAECWMGNNDNRPWLDSNKAKVHISLDRFRENTQRPAEYSDVWGITRIPHRDNVMNRTYSCVFGLQGRYGSFDSEFIFQNVGNYGFYAFDAGKRDITYRELQQKRNNYADSTFEGLYYDWDTDVDDRQDTTPESLNPFESPDREHPYCPGLPRADIICGSSGSLSENNQLSDYQ